MMEEMPTFTMDNGFTDARQYLTSFCWNGDPFCPRCNENNIYELKDGRMRCGGCGYTFHDFSGRWINRVQLPPRYWLKIVAKFSAGLNTTEIAEALMVSYNTVFKALHVIRLAVICQGRDAHRFVDHRSRFVDFCARHKNSLKKGRRIVCQAPVFGIRHENGSASLYLLEECTGHEALRAAPLKKLWREVVYTDSWAGFDGLIFSCCKTFREQRRIPETEAKLGLDAAEGFWPFAKRRLSVYHCMSPVHFPLYLKEQEFRYAHRGGDLPHALLKALCSFVPNLAH